MQKKLFLIVCFLLTTAGCAAHKSVYLSSPSMLPDVTRPMKTAGFWIGRHPWPDRLILDQDSIRTFNERMADPLKLTADITNYPQNIDTNDLRQELQNQLHAFSKGAFYFSDGRAADKDFFEKIEANMNFEALEKGLNARRMAQFGFIVHYADQRLLPADQILTAEPGYIDFDEVQNSSLDVATPIVVLHESQDGAWFYVRSYASDGWVRKEFVALCLHQDLKNWEGQDSFIVTTSPKADLYLDPAMRRHYDYVQMGRRFPLIEELSDGILQVLLPIRTRDGQLLPGNGYFRKDDVHVGYLSYTPRNVISQAFKLLNAPYGWGGMYGEQDCSRFLQQVFATVGMTLPRNSKAQIAVSPPMAIFSDTAEARDKKDVLRRALAGVTLLYFKGHIMLYLGMVDDKPYAIHATWAYRENKGEEEVVRVINKVVVSSLDLGRDSGRGSLLSRLEKIVQISNVPRKGGCGCSSRK